MGKLVDQVLNDGQTRRAKISAPQNPELGSFEIEYRLAMAKAVETFFKSQDSAGTGTLRAGVIATTIRDHLVSWSVKDAAGAAVPITGDAILRLPWSLQQRTLNVVLGMAPGNPADDASGDEIADKSDEARLIAEAESIIEADAKNSARASS